MGIIFDLERMGSKALYSLQGNPFRLYSISSLSIIIMQSFNKLTSIRNPIDLSEYLLANPQLNLVPMKDKFEANLLHHCAFNNLFENMKVLIRHVKEYYDGHTNVVSTRIDKAEQFKMNLSAWINQANHEGYLPVHYACLNGNVEMIKYLEELGGNLLYKSNMGENLVHMCAESNQVAPLLYLYNKNINFQQGNKNRQTPLYVAASKGSIEVVGLLVTLKQVDINHANKNDETPLIAAVKESQNQVVKRLLLKGADRSLINNEGKTAYLIAKERNDGKLARILNEQRTCLDKIKILCNKKTVYKKQDPSLMLVFGFILMFLTSTVPTNAIIDLPLPDIIATIIFYVLYSILYISLLFGPKKKQPLFFKHLSSPFCPECRTNKIPRSYHCYFCQTCIYRYDHHCPWINNCVGWHNAGRFTIFLVLTFVALVETAVLTVYEGFVLKNYRFSFSNSEIIFTIFHVWTMIVCLFIYPVLTLMYAQFKSLFLNKTSYERHHSSPHQKQPKKESLLDDSAHTQSQALEEDEEQQDCAFSNACLMCKPPPEVRQYQ